MQSLRAKVPRVFRASYDEVRVGGPAGTPAIVYLPLVSVMTRRVKVGDSIDTTALTRRIRQALDHGAGHRAGLLGGRSTDQRSTTDHDKFSRRLLMSSSIAVTVTANPGSTNGRREMDRADR
jgi:hypothetical protein